MNFPAHGNAAVLGLLGIPVMFEPGTVDLEVTAIVDVTQFIDSERGGTVKETVISVEPDDRFVNNSRWLVNGKAYRQQGPQMTDGAGLSEIALVAA